MIQTKLKNRACSFCTYAMINSSLWVISSYSPGGKPHTILENWNIATLSSCAFALKRSNKLLVETVASKNI